MYDAEITIQDPAYCAERISKLVPDLLATDAEERECAMTDILVYLRHIADNKDIDIFAALDRSYEHYLIERDGLLETE